MRLWHIDLIPYLPKKQLVAQWRELNSIFKDQPKHILINYIYNYNKSYLLNYTQAVIRELYNRNYKIKSLENYNKYFSINKSFGIERFAEHNYDYLEICFYNLKEKYIRGQKDFTEDGWKKLKTFFIEEQNSHLFQFDCGEESFDE